jgi:uncharacterized membrane protein YphA (DoxX/SURF4 family)
LQQSFSTLKQAKGDKMNILLWILQILVALQFVFHAYIVGVRYEQTKTQRGMNWVGELPGGLRSFVAICEVLGGIGVILPALTGILPWLTPLAAAGLALIMLLAIGFHLMRREYPNIVINVILLALAAFVAYGRFVVVPL